MSAARRSLGYEEILSYVEGVPDFDRFLLVDELVDASAALASEPGVEIRRIGSSRLGEPIHELIVGDGPLQALVFAGVHPNEPIGSLTALHLARVLARGQIGRTLGFTWHIVLCIDPDGMRLNEGWFSGAMTRVAYGRQFYRPAPDEQVEWTFPFAYKDAYFDRVIPETLALMRIIDEVRPAFMCSLHNGELGGVYYYLSREAPELYPVLHALPEHLGLPLDTGEPEAPFLPVYAPAIYGEISMVSAYDYAEGLGLDPVETMSAGDSSNAYAAKYGTFSLVSELPYWIHPDASDESPSPTRYADVLAGRARDFAELASVLADVLAAASPDLSTNSPFLRATRAFAPSFFHLAEQEERRAALPESDRLATVAEAFTGADLVHCFRLRYGGMLLRALEAEIAIGNGTPVLRAQAARLGARYEEWGAEALKVTPPHTVALRNLVGVQYGAILAAASYVADGHDATGRGAA